jgi:hypothetical protein
MILLSLKPLCVAASIRNLPMEKLIAKGIAVAEHIARLYPTPVGMPDILITTDHMY